MGDRNVEVGGFIPGNDYALPYLSEWSKMHGEHADMLEHVNCSYFSTPGRPPTLQALKAHLQSLAYAVSILSPEGNEPALQVGAVGDTDTDDDAVDRYSRFDWLRNMKKPYRNRDPDHQWTLNSLVNQVESSHDVLGTKLHCPLAEHVARAPDAPRKPYASHDSLLRHANACLERLDHEYAATGGLLSLLPTDAKHDTDDLRAARNSLLGQWLEHTQRLTARMHELELAYANACDVLAGEAVVPLQHLSAVGVEARARGIVVGYPQDRWVLANAGDDVSSAVHAMLDAREEQLAQREASRRARGAVGERAEGRGIVHVDVVTRYYRVRGVGESTLFVLPAREGHPAVEYTRQAESQPTVVTTAAPREPHWVSDIEKRYDERLEKAAEMEETQLQLMRTCQRLESEKEMLEGDLAYYKDKCKDMDLSGSYAVVPGDSEAEGDARK